MKRVAVAFTGPRAVGFCHEVDRALQPNEVRIRTLFSGISAGTELTAYRGTNPYLHKRWDQPTRLFLDDAHHESQHYPMIGWGYEEVGEVIESAAEVDDIPIGSIVYGTWGHRTMHIMPAPAARQRLLPGSADPLLGVFSQIGAIALNGILDGAIRLGETVAVFGLGVVGQLVAQLAQLSGANVIGVDLLPARREMAKRMGIQSVIDGVGAAETIKELTNRRGADVCFEASGAERALHEAIRACAYSSKVVALGFFQGDGRGLHLGEEFHHNRITIVGSQISGRAPNLQHRWDELRLAQTVIKLAVDDKLKLLPLITHIMLAAEAPLLFKLLDEHPDEALQAVLDFRPALPDTLAFDSLPASANE
jgi:threonine dehydrogenase-like Zn-dependent dehydrogenase